jgi:hypothetical protein
MDAHSGSVLGDELEEQMNSLPRLLTFSDLTVPNIPTTLDPYLRI